VKDRANGEVFSVHLGASANCSSIGSYVDFLFVSAAVSGALLAAVGATLVRRGSIAGARAPQGEDAASGGATLVTGGRVEGTDAPHGDAAEDAEAPREVPRDG
jgi:hypothetical protein